MSGLHVYHKAKQLTDDEFETMDAQVYEIENELKRLIESLPKKVAVHGVPRKNLFEAGIFDWRESE